MVKPFPHDEWATADNIFRFYKYHITAFMMIFTSILSVATFFGAIEFDMGPVLSTFVAMPVLIALTYGLWQATMWFARRSFGLPSRTMHLPFEETKRTIEGSLVDLEIPYNEVFYRDYPEHGRNDRYRDHLWEEPSEDEDWRQVFILDLRGGGEIVEVFQRDEDDTMTMVSLYPYRGDHVRFLDGVMDAIDKVAPSRSE